MQARRMRGRTATRTNSRPSTEKLKTGRKHSYSGRLVNCFLLIMVGLEEPDLHMAPWLFASSIPKALFLSRSAGKSP